MKAQNIGTELRASALGDGPWELFAPTVGETPREEGFLLLFLIVNIQILLVMTSSLLDVLMILP